MRKKKQEKREDKRSVLLLRMLKGGLASVMVAMVILAGMALLVSGGLLSRTIAERSVAAVCAVGALAGTSYVLKGCGRGFLAVGGAVGMIMWLLLLVVGAVCFGGLGGGGGMSVVAIGCLGGGLLAGVLRALRGGAKRNKRDYR